MRSTSVLLAVLLVITLVLITPTEAYRKRKGSGFKSAYWSKTPEEDLKVDTTTKPEKCTRRARTGDIVKVHYTGALREGNKIFDSSVARGEPFEFQLGGGRVIPGWEQGLQGMCVGEKRRLVIPPSLGYGARGYPPQIPPNSYLLFVVEMLEIRDWTPSQAEQDAAADIADQ